MKQLTNVTKLHTRPERLKAEQAEQLKLALEPFREKLREDVLARLIYQIDRETQRTRTTEPFVMLKPAQNSVVINNIIEHSKYKLIAVRLWTMLFENIDSSGQIMLARDEIANALRTSSGTVSTIMRELVSFGAIFTSRQKISGMRGPGIARYYINPHIAEYGIRRSEDDLQKISKPKFIPKIVGGNDIREDKK